jgi:hypothetical protein
MHESPDGSACPALSARRGLALGGPIGRAKPLHWATSRHTGAETVKLYRIVLFIALAAVATGCTSYQVTPVTNAAPGTRSGQVDVLFSNPTRPYQTIGMVSAKRYKPGFSDPTVTDAIEQIRAAGRQVGADGVIVRNHNAPQDRRIIHIEGEAIRYTDVATDSGASGVGMAALAKGFSNGRGCGDVSLVSEKDGRWVYQSVCPAGRTLLVECRGETCNAIN